MTPEFCPNCGEAVPPGAKACPHCGSDEKTGWSEQATEDPLGLEREDFDYEKFVEKEFSGKSFKPEGLSKFWWLIGIIILIMLIFLLLHH